MGAWKISCVLGFGLFLPVFLFRRRRGSAFKRAGFFRGLAGSHFEGEVFLELARAFEGSFDWDAGDIQTALADLFIDLFPFLAAVLGGFAPVFVPAQQAGADGRAAVLVFVAVDGEAASEMPFQLVPIRRNRSFENAVLDAALNEVFGDVLQVVFEIALENGNELLRNLQIAPDIG